MSFDNRTIFAPATLVGESGLTVIRISGADTLPLISQLFSKKAGELVPVDFSRAASHSSHHGYIMNGNTVIDEAVITIFKSPNSFTGEDVVEISSHGGGYIFCKINSLLLALGAFHAEPGEFSKRAYLNGKMDLAQAEAVADLIRARTELSSSLALKQLTGEFSARINELRTELINYCSLLELELDFAEEGIDLVSRDDLLEKINVLIKRFERLTQSFETGKIIKNGVNLAIVGKPNVGKSSIFNYLLDESRAIVSDIPGTTRDFLQELLMLGGVAFNVIDTAGIRHSKDSIEQEGVKRSIQKIDEADIVLEVTDLSAASGEGEYAYGIDEAKIIRVHNKADLVTGYSNTGLNVSAKTGLNMEQLIAEIVQKANKLTRGEEGTELIITNERHRDALLKSCQYLVNAKQQISSGGGNELISFDVRAAMDSLGEIVGKTSNVDILNNIFSKFCIGK
jgi:tRNA modification GTPase